MVVRAHSSCLVGIEAAPVIVELQLSRGLPGFELIGIPERAARECSVRVRAALASTGIDLPPKHLVVSIAPSEHRKALSCLDLPVAVAVLAALGVLEAEPVASTFFLSELSLSGALRSVRGGLVHLLHAASRGQTQAIVAADQLDAADARGITVGAAKTLDDVVQALRGRIVLPSIEKRARVHVPASLVDLADVAGHASCKRALAIAAAGGHGLLLTGPPGSGKTMLARRLVGLLPAPDDHESLELATIASAAGQTVVDGTTRPFRAPHHTASAAALIGGGDPIRPGEVTLAHGGVLFLDELPEFRRDAIESLRTTMEGGVVTVVRTHGRITMPASPLIVAAMNPCPCGYAGDSTRLCVCSSELVARYRSRVSGPILDRFDLHVHVPRQAAAALAAPRDEEYSSSALRLRVERAREILCSSRSSDEVSRTLRSLDANARTLLERAIDRLALSARVHAKVVRLARSIAALRNSESPRAEDVAEALSLRTLDGSRSDALAPS